ncbi:hypothetical protein BV20DRAFT_1008223 [Pilatotrama ljubarskyi]|nr:hypothetical protein BV20DRAFT_1008223 [Pilatotrama ljubarskyi]
MLSLLVLAAISGTAQADITPIAPGPGDTFAAGSDCTIKWTGDQTGQWTNVSIYLMSGSNDNMTRVTTVAAGLDGTDSSLSPYNWTCPDVDPYSAIYFYQFTNGDDRQESTWTSRFAITSADGDSEPPEHDAQSNGDAIPWGTGHLASAIDVTAEEAGANDSPPDGPDQEDPDNSSTPLTHRHSTTDVASDTASSSLYWTANSLSARPTHPWSSHPTASGEAAAEDTIPTASLPARKAHASHTASPSPSSPGPSSSGMPCSAMGPGVPQMGGMKLASTAIHIRGMRWLQTASLYPVLVAMLL